VNQDTDVEKSKQILMSVGSVSAHMLGVAQETCPFFAAVLHDVVSFHLVTVGTWVRVGCKLARSHSTGLVGLGESCLL